MRYSFRAYGLTLNSDTPLPSLREETNLLDSPDIEMSFGPEPPWVRGVRHLPFRVAWPVSGVAEEDESQFTLTSFGVGDYFELAYGDRARFLMDGSAKRLWGTYLPPLTLEDLATYLLGPVMGFVLRRRGTLALHGSSVSISGHAVILCGPSESGKSTIAAALALRGFPVLTEDISPVLESRGSSFVEPGYPRVCLWPETVSSLLGAPDTLPRLTPTWEKCFLPLDGKRAKFEPNKLVLGTVYVLGQRVNEADAPRIENLAMRGALVELVQNTYMNWLLDRDQRADELSLLTSLVARVPVKRVVPHEDPRRLAALCDLIIKDAQSLQGRRAFAAIGRG